MKRRLDVYDLGNARYQPVWDLQKRAQQLLIKQKRGELSGSEGRNDIFFFVEHPHVYTLGKSGDSANLLKSISELSNMDAEFMETDRGGDITYHGPGQVVGYPILDLDQHFTDIHKYLRYLEEVIIRSCADFGIKAGRIDGLTGVWVGREKICAMGIRCSRWVTMHGFALNVNTDLSYFGNIVPCGISDKEVTSLSKCVGHRIEEDDVKEKLLKHFSEVFDVEVNKHDSVPEPYSQFSYL